MCVSGTSSVKTLTLEMKLSEMTHVNKKGKEVHPLEMNIGLCVSFNPLEHVWFLKALNPLLKYPKSEG